MSLIDAPRAGDQADSRWALDPYPDYVVEVNRSIAFSGVNQEFFTRGKAKRLLQALRRRGHDPRAMRLLDIGCGIGLIHPYVCEEFQQVTGVDLAADALRAAKRANPSVTYRQQTGTSLPVEAGSFDVAAAVCVMHHVPVARQSEFLASAFAAIRPGGLLFVFEHNPWNPLTRWAVANCPFDFDAVLLSGPRLRRRLSDAGFVDIESESLFFTPFANAASDRLEALLRAVPLGAQHLAIGRRPV